MKIKSIVTIFTIALLYSCGSKKAAVNQEELVADIKSYVNDVDNEANLKNEVTEGALTDDDGFKDIGSFQYTVYFNESNELFKIKNIEKTSQTTTETYYFRDNALVYLKSVLGNETKSIYLKKGRVISETNTSSDDQQLLLAKAGRFQKSFSDSLKN